MNNQAVEALLQRKSSAVLEKTVSQCLITTQVYILRVSRIELEEIAEIIGRILYSSNSIRDMRNMKPFSPKRRMIFSEPQQPGYSFRRP